MSAVEKGDGNKSDKTRVVRKNALTLYKEGVKHERKNQERLLSDIKIAIKQSYSDDLKTLIAETVERTFSTNNFSNNIDRIVTKSFESDAFKNNVKNVVEAENTTQTGNVIKGNKRHWLLDIGIGVLSSLAFGVLLIVVDAINKHENKDSNKPTENVKQDSELQNMSEKDTTSTITPYNEK